MILKKIDKESSEIEFLPIKKTGKKFYVELHDEIQNGFPSPADDFTGRKISLDERYFSKPESTFVGRAKGYSNAPYILPGDFLIIRSDIEVKQNDLTIVYISGEGFTAKVADFENSCLRSLNKKFPVIEIPENEIIETRGIVHAIFRDVESITKIDWE